MAGWVERLDECEAPLMAESLWTRRRRRICWRIDRRRSATDRFPVRYAQWSPLAMLSTAYGVNPGSSITRIVMR
jgi:hypothetical protein